MSRLIAKDAHAVQWDGVNYDGIHAWFYAVETNSELGAKGLNLLVSHMDRHGLHRSYIARPGYWLIRASNILVVKEIPPKRNR